MKEVDLGMHIILNFYGCDSSKLNDYDFLKKTVDEILDKMKVSKIGEMNYKFEPVGLTYVIGIKESHISIHTWPERGEATIDIYTCGKESPLLGYEILVEKLKPKTVDAIFIDRRTMSIVFKKRETF